MDLKRILLVLRARLPVALLVLLATVGVALALNAYLPRKYTATTSLVVDMRTPDPISALFRPGNLNTQIAIIESDRVARSVVRLLKLDENPEVRETWIQATHGKGEIDAWIAEALLRGVTVNSAGQRGDVVTISYTGRDPNFTAAVANAFAKAYIDTLLELKVGPATQYARWFDEQIASLRKNLEKAQEKLSAYQQKNGIVATDDRVDTESARLDTLSKQLTSLQAENTNARSKERYRGDLDSLPDVLGNAMVQQLRGQIVQKEAELSDAAVNLGVNHPKYRSLEAQLAELKRKLAAETRQVRSSIAAAGAVGRRNETELKTAIAAQKKKLLELKSKRDQMEVLKRDVHTAQAAYDAVAKRLTQTQLESRATETNVTVLNPASVPTTSSWPKPLNQMLLLSAFLGIVLGVGAAFLVEMLDQRVRSVEDLAEMLQLPVLGVVENRGRRTALPRRRPALALK